MSILYITYDGLLEPLGQSQVLAYLERMSDRLLIHIMSFEKEEDWENLARRTLLKRRIDKARIVWHPLRYHKRPSVPATAYDIAKGTAFGALLVRRHKLKLIHARSYVPAMMALGIKGLTGARFLFDMRGFWADERVDGGLWPAASQRYKAAKTMERHFIRAADHIVTLTHASLREMTGWPDIGEKARSISVIPTCADLDLFKIGYPQGRLPLVFGYVGSVGTWYLLDEMFAFFKALQHRRSDARFLFVNRRDHELIRRTARASGVDAAVIEIVSAEHNEVPGHLARMHAAGALIKPAYSKMSSAPTKLAEYLGCGVACVGNAGVGDMEEILDGEHVGIAMRGFSPEEYEATADRLLTLIERPGTRETCAAVAHRLFSVETGVQAYLQIYERLLGLASA